MIKKITGSCVFLSIFIFVLFAGQTTVHAQSIPSGDYTVEGPGFGDTDGDGVADSVDVCPNGDDNTRKWL